MIGIIGRWASAAIAIAVVVSAAVLLSLGSPAQNNNIPEPGVDGIMVTNGVKHLVSLEKIIGGGPPKDGIPSIDRPKFVSAGEANFLTDDDLGLGIELDSTKKFYPFRVLVWHEIVNDNINNKPVLITYCPLCQSGIAFNRAISGQAVEFGTSGKLYNSNLVMYDRLTDSYWYQITGQAIVGELTGAKLEKIPIETIKWGDWKRTHPDTLVLSTDTGFLRDYNRDPYGDYYTSTGVFFPVENMDSRLQPKTFGYAIDIDGSFKFYPREEVAKAVIVNDKVGEKDILVLSDPETGAIRSFDRNLEGEPLEFKIEGGRLLDKSGSEWSFKGEGISGQHAGSKLAQIVGADLFWFSWVADHPGSEVFNA